MSPVILTIDDVARAAEGRLAGAPPPPAATVDGATIDSRSLRPGQLFVAVEAERDGHDFVAAAAAAGAAAALVARPVEADLPQVVVADPVVALGEIAKLARDQLDGPVIGITGSVGKTSTKDLLAAVCGRAGPTTASARSLNNEMGVPLTLLGASPDTDRTIVEMGARGVGHIASLCRIARPTFGVVTAVAAAHVEMFGDLDGVARAKGELIDALPVGGTAVLNADDPRVAAMASRCSGRVLTYGDAGEVLATRVELDDDLCASFRLVTPWGSTDVRLGVRGRHNVANALAAAATALASGVLLTDVAEGLEAAELSPSRMHLVRLPSGGIVLDDAYNANPASMRAGLASLAAIEADRHVAVLGVMAELGEDAAEEHALIAEEAAGAGIEVVAVGTDLYGVPPLAGVDEVLATVPPPGPGEAVLLKGSRVAGLDRVAREWTLEGSRPG